MNTTIAVSNEGAVDVLTDVGARRAPRITRADVFRTADELLVDGHRPTIDRVRMRLGRGSPNTINEHLDAWWTQLGARLRDLPGREFPQLPERVAHALQRLWNEALEGAHEALQATVLEREQTIAQREHALEGQTRQLIDREQASAARTASMEETLLLAREQLFSANRRAEALEATLQARTTECNRLQTRIEALQASVEDLRRQFDATMVAHQIERTKLQEQYTTAEARWLTEVDRARQGAKDARREHERQLTEFRRAVSSLQSDRDRLTHELLEIQGDLKAATAMRQQLEERLRRMTISLRRNPRTIGSQGGRPRKVKHAAK